MKISLKNIPHDYFAARLARKFGDVLTLVQDFTTVDSKSGVDIHCSSCGLTSSLPYSLLFAKDTKKGCPYCRHNKKHRVFGFTNEIFLQEAQNKWGDRFMYPQLSLRKDVRAEDQEIEVFCTICNLTFTTNVRYHLYLNNRGGGCTGCSSRLNKINFTWTTEIFIERAQKKWGDLYNYDKVVYSNVDTPVQIYCNTHQGSFFLTPYKHLNNKYGCPICGNKRKNQRTKVKMQEKFKEEMKCRENESGLCLDSARYSGFLSPVKLQCSRCGCSFSIIGQHFLNKGGRCPVCYPPRYFSKASQIAIKRIEEACSIRFISSLIGYEYIIKRNKNIFKVDAYNEELNLIVEFYGDLFHGNPNLFSAEHRCHPYDKEITAHELYTKTKEREKYILEQGYNLFTIWDSEWVNNSNAILQKIKSYLMNLRGEVTCV